MIERSIFEKTKDEVSIFDLADRLTVLRGGSNQKRGRCPIKGCGKKSKTLPFVVFPTRGNFHCYGCGARGDVIELAVQVLKVTPLEACRDLLGGQYEPPPPPAEAREQDAKSLQQKLDWATELWDFGRPIQGSLAERYLLESRGILPEVVAMIAPALRYHPFAKHSWDPKDKSWTKGPALLCRPETPAGPTGGVHATFLLRDGSGRDKALGKLMIGPQTGQDGLPGVVWLIGPVADGFDGTTLLEGEGLESAASLGCFAFEKGRKARLVATLSLDRMQGGIQKDADNCIDLSAPRPARNRAGDLVMPAFVWPNPPEQPWPEVVVGVDGDMSPMKVKARSGRGKPMEVVLDPVARAALCGRLATRAWRDAGCQARAIVPPGLRDFNDEWLCRLEAKQEGRTA